MRFVLAMALLTLPISAQDSLYSIPKYPPKMKMSTRDAGVRPGTAVGKNDPTSASFRRTYSKPAGLRLLVRVPCSASLGREELIQRAKSISAADGPPVQIDWEAIRGGRVSYYAVIYTEKTISHVDLVARAGVYRVRSKRKITEEGWDVQRLSFGAQGACVRSEELTERAMKVAVINVLNTASLKHFRSGGGP